MTTYITYAAPIDIQQKRHKKARQLAANYVGTNADNVLMKRRLDAVEKRLRRMSYGLNDHEKEVVQRWKARKQRRMLQQHVHVSGIQTNSRKI